MAAPKDQSKTTIDMNKIDAILSAIAADRKSYFMEPKQYDAEICQQIEFRLSFGIIPRILPPLFSFLNPNRYIKNALGFDNEYVDKPEPCQQVLGIMSYLSMAAKIDGDYQTFYLDSTLGRTATKQVINKFFSLENKSKFSICFVLMSLHQFTLNAPHYFSIIKLDDQYRLLQSFGNKFSLAQELKRRNWKSCVEMKSIVDKLLYLESVATDDKQVLPQDIQNIKNYSNSVFGFPLELQMNKSMRGYRELEGSVMYDLSVKHFETAAKHAIAYMTSHIQQYKFTNVKQMKVPLCYRVGYPTCMDHECLKKMNEENGWGYDIN